MGARFEEAVRFFFKNDAFYRGRFINVWAWKDAPMCDGHDYGIDIVAQEYDGSYWAVQCKCWDENSVLTEKALGTFFSAAVPSQFAHRMIVATTERYSSNLEKIAAKWNTVRLNVTAMHESGLDWEPFIQNRPAPETRHIFEPLPHQQLAIKDCLTKFGMGIKRGQLIMACGTGKTLTALRLAEEKCGRGSLVLFLAPSISLVAQSLRAWAAQAREPLRAEAVCSDESASRTQEDAWENSLADMPFPATTDAAELAHRIATHPNPVGLTVIFSTYQSIDVIHEAQRQGMADFDFIICDEAHRTAGAYAELFISAAKAPDNAENYSSQSIHLDTRSNFVKIHDKNYIRGKYRLYMTATPKIYGDKAMRQAKAGDYIVFSMDDADTFGIELHKLSFGEAVHQGLLSDYRALALTVSVDDVAPFAQRLLADNEGLDIDEHSLQRAVNARLVKKCGTRVYWEDWAKDIADIAAKHIARIRQLVADASPAQPRGPVRNDFLRFLRGLRDSLNEGIGEDEAMEMLAQHVITLPVFEALFGEQDFAADNPVSQSMERMLGVLQEHELTDSRERRELDALYASVRARCSQVKTDLGRQKLIKELDENFFRHAFKRTSEKMGML